MIILFLKNNWEVIELGKLNYFNYTNKEVVDGVKESLNAILDLLPKIEEEAEGDLGVKSAWILENTEMYSGYLIALNDLESRFQQDPIWSKLGDVKVAIATHQGNCLPVRKEYVRVSKDQTLIKEILPVFFIDIINKICRVI